MKLPLRPRDRTSRRVLWFGPSVQVLMPSMDRLRIEFHRHRVFRSHSDRSSVTIAGYKRNARTLGELSLGDLLPLNAALPERGIATGLPTAPRGRIENSSASSTTSRPSTRSGPQPGRAVAIVGLIARWGELGPCR